MQFDEIVGGAVRRQGRLGRIGSRELGCEYRKYTSGGGGSQTLTCVR